MWKLFKNNKHNNSNTTKSNSLTSEDESFIREMQKEKSKYLPKDALTREDLVKEIEKQFQKQKSRGDDPFRTKEDVYFDFFNSNMSINRKNVPFQEVLISGKVFYINKRFENGKIIIDEMFGSPDVEINLKDEYDKQETTKKQLEKLNKFILLIKNKIASGEEKYKLIDLEDLKEEKWRLEKILESIKYGKFATFYYENPLNGKKTYMLRYVNGEYKYLKVTENNFLTEENNIKFIKGYSVRNKLEEVLNLRIKKNWREIAIAVLTIVFLCCAAFGLFKLMTHDEVLFDKRVQSYCGEQMQAYQDELENIKDWKCGLTYAQQSNKPLEDIAK